MNNWLYILESNLGLVITNVGLLILFSACGTDEGIGAEAIVENVCEQVEQVNSFDVTEYLTFYDDKVVSRTLTITTLVSGDDSYQKLVTDDGQIYESIRVGGLNSPTYTHKIGEGWDSLETPPGTSIRFPYKIEKGCPDLSRYSYKGEEKLGNRTLRRYGLNSDSDSVTDGIWDLFVDAGGLLVQAEKVDSFQTADGVSQLRKRAVFSEIGEPNRITLPAEITQSISTQTPTPTPTPTPISGSS